MHHHNWAQDRARTPTTMGEELLEPMVCHQCHATGHRDHSGGVTGIEMRLSPLGQPMTPGRVERLQVCLLCHRLQGRGREAWLSQEDNGRETVTRACCYPNCQTVEEQENDRKPENQEEMLERLEAAERRASQAMRLLEAVLVHLEESRDYLSFREKMLELEKSVTW